MERLNLAIAGATGAVGQEFLRLLEERDLPFTSLKLLASERSAGKTLACRGQTYTVEVLGEDSFADVDIAFFSAGGSSSKRYASLAAQAGAVVIDNSSAFRMTDGVPLVVPEVNPEAIDEAGIALGGGRHGNRGGVIANPNCSTIIMLMAVTPLHRAVGVERIVVSTYQAASGAGAAAMAELETQTRELLAGTDPADLTQAIFGRQYAFNLFSHNSDMGPEGYNTEEMKMVKETHKIWGQPIMGPDSARITATCVRVPVMRAHAESVNLTLREPIAVERARAVIGGFPGVSLIDDRAANRFPEPVDASGRDDCFVGRIRRDLSQPVNDAGEAYGLDLFVCGDQIRKGAALNGLQIAELLVAKARVRTNVTASAGAN